MKTNIELENLIYFLEKIKKDIKSEEKTKYIQGFINGANFIIEEILFNSKNSVSIIFLFINVNNLFYRNPLMLYHK